MFQRVTKLNSILISSQRLGFSTLPELSKASIIHPRPAPALTQTNGTNLAINFDKQTEGKITVVLAPINISNKLTIAQILTGAFAFGTSFSLLSSFSYLMTATFGVGTVASFLSTIRGNEHRRMNNRVLSIEIDTQKNIHINYLKGSKNEISQLVVNKQNFLYNAVRPNTFAPNNHILIKANDQWFSLQRSGVFINNQQLHNLL